MSFKLRILFGALLLIVNQFTHSKTQEQTCEPEYYKSNESPDGCELCDCYLEGSLSSECDINTGQCQCKDHRTGRKCDEFIDGFFCPSLDYHIYEAEYAEKLNDHSINEDRVAPFGERLWTGLGFVHVFDGAQLKFTIDNVKSSGDYDVILRYQTKAEYPWQDIKLTLKSLKETTEHNQICRNPEPFYSSFQLAQGKRNIDVTNYCFEKGQTYEITIEFYQYNKANQTTYWYELSKQDTQKLSIDSVVLLPRLPDDFGLFNKDEDNFVKEQYLECREQFYDYSPSRSQYCVDGMCPVTIDWIGVFECDCNKIGSLNNSCQAIQGACYCKQNVYGQKCDKCIPEAWGLSDEGCQSCNCNKDGSRSDICDDKTGQCSCHDNISGATCDRCADGHFEFPLCKQCNCNGHSTKCDDLDGTCSKCQNHTTGDHCELCEQGYIGNPSAGQPCIKCMCPGVDGKHFASSCSQIDSSEEYQCNCKVGYTGKQCDQCDTFYYGNLSLPEGECKMCECNGKADVNDPDACDKVTGQCLKCAAGTDGWNCDKCKDGHFGDPKHFCEACNCNSLGTQSNDEKNCNSETGQCLCLPNVVGSRCDLCLVDHWDFQSGQGCKKCDCDPTGVVHNETRCDAETGQCFCKEGRSGRRCEVSPDVPDKQPVVPPNEDKSKETNEKEPVNPPNEDKSKESDGKDSVVTPKEDKNAEIINTQTTTKPPYSSSTRSSTSIISTMFSLLCLVISNYF